MKKEKERDLAGTIDYFDYSIQIILRERDEQNAR